ncbi:hypothetical protein GALMADRAFT_205382 [Galerina marginata CBS 339.88]|uniref:snRNA-activating protein complex subunit 4 n=1 Tax=Galerina marginata (strain CBS 339.88) TaxID=685588 RepID=A0A067TWH9_GALM3|nr:hypothetical protein GALMADRAFT_205382 [Galerina marginata CBS 339.88]
MFGIVDSAMHIITRDDPRSKCPKKLIQDALDANKRLQQSLTDRAEQLEAELKEADERLEAANMDEGEDDPESEILIPGAKKAVGLFPSSEFLNPSSPFYDDSIKRSSYLANTTGHPMKAKDLEALSIAVRQENERLRAYKQLQSQHPNSGLNTDIDIDNNVEGLDWARIAEKVSDSSSVTRTATECRVVWVGDRHPRINHAEWSKSEVSKLNSIVSEPLKEKKPVDWVNVAETLGTNRTPLDCTKHGLPQHRHNWTIDADQRLVKAVQSCGIDNWQLVARNVSEYVTAGQCQGRWQKTLNPALRRRTWSAEEDELLRKAVAGYGKSWVQVATSIPGRTNDQCRERWNEHVNLSSANIDWSEAEDKNLLGLVESLGNQWKVISFKIGNNKTGQNCRMRYDKLKRLQKKPVHSSGNPGGVTTGTSSIAGPSQLVQMRNPEECMSILNLAVGGHESFSQSPSATLPTPASTVKPRPRPKAVWKGKTKESVPAGGPSAQIPTPEPADTSQTPLPKPALETQPIPKKPRKKATEGTFQPDAIKAGILTLQPKPRPKASKKMETVAVLTEISTADDRVATNDVPQSELADALGIALLPTPKPQVSKGPEKVPTLADGLTADATLAPPPAQFLSRLAAPTLKGTQASTSKRGRKRKALEPPEGELNQGDSSADPVSPDHVSDPAMLLPGSTTLSRAKRGRTRKTTKDAGGTTNSILSFPTAEPLLESTSTRVRKRKSALKSKDNDGLGWNC